MNIMQRYQFVNYYVNFYVRITVSTSFYSALKSLINNRSDQYESVKDSIQTIYIIKNNYYKI